MEPQKQQAAPEDGWRLDHFALQVQSTVAMLAYRTPHPEATEPRPAYRPPWLDTPPPPPQPQTRHRPPKSGLRTAEQRLKEKASLRLWRIGMT
jgi:hypothetical protein